MTGTWVSSPLRAFERLSIRAAVVLGFGVILLVWLIYGMNSIRRISEAEARLSDINTRVTRNEELLYTVRAKIPIADVYLRDNILERSDFVAPYYRAKLIETRKEIEEALDGYVPVTDSVAEREGLRALQAELNDYWGTIMPVVEWDSDLKEEISPRYLQKNLGRRRNLILSISNRIQALNRNGFERRKQELSGVYTHVRERLWWSCGMAAILGALIASLVSWWVSRLESHILRQHAREQQHRNDLRRLSAQLVQAQEHERRALARELHDEVGQALTAVKMELTLAERTLGWRDKARIPLHEARSITDRTLQAVRDLSRLLHPSMLDDLGLAVTVNWHLQGFSKRTGIQAELALHAMEQRLPPETEVTAYRIVQEALNNVAKHSHATTCCVMLRRRASSLFLSVNDNGKGFDPAAVLPAGRVEGLGLIGMQERVAALGGTMRLESAPGKGTSLLIELPSTIEAGDGGARDAEGVVAAPAGGEA